MSSVDEMFDVDAAGSGEAEEDMLQRLQMMNQETEIEMEEALDEVKESGGDIGEAVDADETEGEEVNAGVCVAHP